MVAHVFEGLWNCGGVCNTDEGTREDFQKWCWFYLEGIASLDKEAVRLIYLLFIN